MARQKFLCSKSGILVRVGFVNYYQNIYWTPKGGLTGSICLHNFFSLLRSNGALARAKYLAKEGKYYTTCNGLVFQDKSRVLYHTHLEESSKKHHFLIKERGK